MMKNLFSTTAILAAMTTAGAANAQGLSGDWYASVFGGLSFGADATYDASDNFAGYDEVLFITELESGITAGATIGMEVSPGLRAEAEVSYASYEDGEYLVEYSPGSPGSYSYGDIELEATANYLMANIWYDVDSDLVAGVAPYVGGGLGTVSVDVEDESASSFAYQIGAGVTYPVGTGALDVGYRFKSTGELEFDNITIEPISTSNIQAAYRINF